MKLRKYDEKELKKLQQIELKILKEFISICDKHSLDYYLYGGTNLGAIRHSGFIPWDDDIDVIMFRDDYNKFLKIISEREMGEFKLINSNVYEDYFLQHSKLTLKNTKFEEWWNKQVSYDVGIFIDIFCLDNVPNSPKKRDLHVKTIRCINKAIAVATLKDIEYRRDISRNISKIIHQLLKIIHLKPKHLQKISNKLLTKYKEDKCDFVCDICSLNYTQIYDKKDFIPPKKVKFEDIEANVPNNSDKILTQIYGDYMQMPPEDKRYNHAPEKLDFGPY